MLTGCFLYTCVNVTTVKCQFLSDIKTMLKYNRNVLVVNGVENKGRITTNYLHLRFKCFVVVA